MPDLAILVPYSLKIWMTGLFQDRNPRQLDLLTGYTEEVESLAFLDALFCLTGVVA